MLRPERQRRRRQGEAGERAQETFGTNARKARQRAGFTQLELAKKTGLTQKWVSEIELGKANVGIRTMVAVAKAVNVPLHKLVTPP